MKSFSQFLTEAITTSASAQAKRMGLIGNGHGDWYDSQGKLVAKTIKGKLEIFKGRQPSRRQEPEPEQRPTPKVQPTPQLAKVVPQQVQQQPSTEVPQTQPVAQQPIVQQEPQIPQTTGVVVVFGRFNPPTVGHEKLLKVAAKQARLNGYDLRIYPSRSHDAKKNPLEPGLKIEYMKKMFPDYAENIIDDKSIKTIFNVLVNNNEEGYQDTIMVVGGDRLSEFQALSHKYNGDLYNYNKLEVISAGDRDPDSDDVSGMSASKMRLAAAEDEFKTFAKGLPNTLNNMDKRELFNVLRKSMKISESTELWEVAPKLDLDGLRDAYISDEVYHIGTYVENLNTGMSGEIIRRGTNYVICVSETGDMFKSWLKDIMEYTEVKMDRMYREPGKPNTLVGTLGAFKYFAKMTPGAIGVGAENLQPGGKPYGVKYVKGIKQKTNK